MAVGIGAAGYGAIAAGGALAAGGVGAAIRAARMKSKPRGVQYGGSVGAGDALQDTYGAGVDQGNGTIGQGATLLGQSAGAGDSQAAVGQNLLSNPNSVPAFRSANVGREILAGYQPGQVSATAARAAIDQNAQATMAAGRTGGQLGLRNAVNAGAFSGVNAAQNIAAQTAQEQQAYLGARVAQENTQEGVNAAGYNSAMGQRLSTGANLLNSGNALSQNAGSGLATVGGGERDAYLAQQQNLLDTQNANAMDYEQRRQADQQRKSNNLFNFAGALVGAGGQVASAGVSSEKK